MSYIQKKKQTKIIRKRFKYFVDLLDGTLTTGKVHPHYKGFYSIKKARIFSESFIKNKKNEAVK